MRVDFEGVPPAANMPAGIRIDQLDPELDVDAAFDAHHEAFADHWGETEETLEEFRHWLIDTPRFDRELSLLARDGPVVAGYLFAWLDAEENRRAVTSPHSARVVPTAAEGSPKRCCGTSSARCSTAASEAATCTSTRTR